MAVLLTDVWYSGVIDGGCVSFRILWIKFKFSGLRFVWWWWGTAQMKEMVKKGRFSELSWTELQEKGVWKSTKRKRERLKGAFIREKGGPRTVWKEDESRCERKLEIVLEECE